MRLLQTVLALMVLGGWTAPSRADDLVVIASSDPTVEIGAVIDGGQSMSVAADTSVVLISSAGRTITLSGPYRGAPDASGSSAESRLVDSLSRLITQDAESSGKLAAFRGGSKQAPEDRPDIWGIDIAHAGTYCLRPDRKAMLWWDAARAGAVVSISGPGGAPGIRIRWPSAKRHLAWPKALALGDHATYLARFRSVDAGEALKTRLMPDLDTDAHRAAWMAEHGCDQQALKVLEAMARDALRPRP